jgi:hypothetical protein
MSRKRRDSVKASNNGSKNAGPALDMGLDMAMEMMMPDVEVTSQDHTEGTHPSNETALATDCIPLGRVGVNNAEHECDLLRKLDETMQTLENLMMENEQISEQKDDLVAKLEGTMDAVDELVVENEQLEGQLLEAKTDIVSIKARFNAAVAQLDLVQVEIETKEAIIQDIKEKSASLQAKLESKNNSLYVLGTNAKHELEQDAEFTATERPLQTEPEQLQDRSALQEETQNTNEPAEERMHLETGVTHQDSHIESMTAKLARKDQALNFIMSDIDNILLGLESAQHQAMSIPDYEDHSLDSMEDCEHSEIEEKTPEPRTEEFREALKFTRKTGTRFVALLDQHTANFARKFTGIDAYWRNCLETEIRNQGANQTWLKAGQQTCRRNDEHVGTQTSFDSACADGKTTGDCQQGNSDDRSVDEVQETQSHSLEDEECSVLVELESLDDYGSHAQDTEEGTAIIDHATLQTQVWSRANQFLRLPVTGNDDIQSLLRAWTEVSEDVSKLQADQLTLIDSVADTASMSAEDLLWFSSLKAHANSLAAAQQEWFSGIFSMKEKELQLKKSLESLATENLRLRYREMPLVEYDKFSIVPKRIFIICAWDSSGNSAIWDNVMANIILMMAQYEPESRFSCIRIQAAENPSFTVSGFVPPVIYAGRYDGWRLLPTWEQGNFNDLGSLKANTRNWDRLRYTYLAKERCLRGLRAWKNAEAQIIYISDDIVQSGQLAARYPQEAPFTRLFMSSVISSVDICVKGAVDFELQVFPDAFKTRVNTTTLDSLFHYVLESQTAGAVPMTDSDRIDGGNQNR